MIQADSVLSTQPTSAPEGQSRRSFLGRAVKAMAASTALSAAAVGANRLTLAAAIEEDPAVVALGERINPLLTAYRHALAARQSAHAAAEANCPNVPDEILCKGSEWLGVTEREMDVMGKDVWPANYVDADGKTYAKPPRLLFNSRRAKDAIERGNLYCNRRTKFGKRLAKLIDTAERYETEREAAIERSGLAAAQDQLHWAARDIEVMAYEAAKTAPKTMAGVAIQARVLSAYAEVEIEIEHYRGRSGQLLGLALAESVSRVAGKAVA